MLQFTASQIAQLIQGKVEGDPAIAVHSFGKIEEAVAGDRKSTRLNSSHVSESRMPSSA